MKKNYIIFCLIFTVSCFGQYSGLGTWNIYNIKYNYSEKWSFFAEAQLRSLSFYSEFHYYEYKGGITYKPNKNIGFSLAMGDYDTYDEGGNFVTPKRNDEFRIWPQIVLNQKIGKFKIEQRYRMEMRFTSNGYRNRFRYRIGITYPFGKERNGVTPFFITGNNELFFTDNEPFFERNRTALNLGYKISKQFSIQAGYLYQFDYRINDETGRDFFQIGIYMEFFRPKNEKAESSDLPTTD